MTGDQLKRWRTNRGLSQEQLAAYFGDDWTRQRIANLETERTTMADDVTARLVAIATLLDQQTAPSSKSLPKKRKLDFSGHKCWSLDGTPIDMAHVERQPIGYHFYRWDGSNHYDDETGHPIANLWETTRRYPTGQCTFFQVDLQTWQVRCVAWHDHPAHIRTLPMLNAKLDAVRAAGVPANLDKPQSTGMFAQPAL